MSKVLLGFCAVIPAVALMAAASAQAEPALEITQKILDFGRLPINSTAEGVFTVHNKGTEALTIREVRPTCGCTVADFDRTIAPGRSGSIRTVLDTAGYRGPVSWALMVFTNDPTAPQVNLVVRAEVVAFIDVLPRPLVRLNLLEGESATETVVLVSGAGKEFRILGVSGAGESLRTTVRELRGNGRLPDHLGSQWELAVTVLAGAPAGSLSRQLTVHTSAPEARDVAVSVAGTVRPALQTIPAELDFGSVRRSPAAGRNIVVINNKGDVTMEVLGVQSDNPVFWAEAARMGSGERFQVTVTLAEDAPSGAHEGTVTVLTTHPDRPVIQVPVRVRIE